MRLDTMGLGELFTSPKPQTQLSLIIYIPVSVDALVIQHRQLRKRIRARPVWVLAMGPEVV